MVSSQSDKIKTETNNVDIQKRQLLLVIGYSLSIHEKYIGIIRMNSCIRIGFLFCYNKIMDRLLSNIAKPVKRTGAEDYLLITLVSFGVTVLAVRLYLKLAHYPVVGTGPLHIAHLLWGGLALFLAAVAPLVVANRWVYRLSALLSGVGVGLFIDEVGKFITRNNNYFYPGAAPIIYGFFLLMVLVYLRVKRKSSSDARTELYYALDAMEDVLDHDLDTEEHDELVRRLTKVAEQKRNPEYARLANELLGFLNSRVVKISEPNEGIIEQYIEKGQSIEDKILKKKIHKAFLIVGSFLLSIESFSNLSILITDGLTNRSLQRTINIFTSTGNITHGSLLPWYLTRVILQGVGGMILFIGCYLLLIDRDRKGVTLAYYGILFQIAITNLLVFYFDQFAAATGTIIDFVFLLLILRYRHRFVNPIMKRSRG
jgi:hypothetical protein